MDIPRDKNFPCEGAAQCDACGGSGCMFCGWKGWVWGYSQLARKCERDGCGKNIPPDHVAVYCSNKCAAEDGRGTML